MRRTHEVDQQKQHRASVDECESKQNGVRYHLVSLPARLSNIYVRNHELFVFFGFVFIFTELEDFFGWWSADVCFRTG